MREIIGCLKEVLEYLNYQRITVRTDHLTEVWHIVIGNIGGLANRASNILKKYLQENNILRSIESVADPLVWSDSNVIPLYHSFFHSFILKENERCFNLKEIKTLKENELSQEPMPMIKIMERYHIN